MSINMNVNKLALSVLAVASLIAGCAPSGSTLVQGQAQTHASAPSHGKLLRTATPLQWQVDHSLDNVQQSIVAERFVKPVALNMGELAISPISPDLASRISASRALTRAKTQLSDLPRGAAPLIALGSVTVSDYGKALPDGSIAPAINGCTCWTIIYRHVRDVGGPVGALNSNATNVPQPKTTLKEDGLRDIIAIVDAASGKVLWEDNKPAVEPKH